MRTEPSNATQADLVQLNHSGVSGTADVLVAGRRVDVQVAARNERPTVRGDDNADHRLTTSEGQRRAAYPPGAHAAIDR